VRTDPCRTLWVPELLWALVLWVLVLGIAGWSLVFRWIQGWWP
jgi:hypothetical protein